MSELECVSQRVALLYTSQCRSFHVPSENTSAQVPSPDGWPGCQLVYVAGVPSAHAQTLPDLCKSNQHLSALHASEANKFSADEVMVATCPPIVWQYACPSLKCTVSELNVKIDAE